MKKIFILACAVLFVTPSFATKVKTEVYEVVKGLNLDDETREIICCYKMVHWIYTDDDEFVTFGTSSTGTCCTSSAEFDELSEDEMNALLSSEAFLESTAEAMLLYNLTKAGQVSEAKVYPNPSSGTINIKVNAPTSGTYKLLVKNFNYGANVYEDENVFLSEGDNTITIDLSQFVNRHYNTFYIKLYNDEILFKAKTIINPE